MSPGGMMSPSGNSASDVRAQGVRGTGRVGGGSGPLCPKRWGTSPLNRGESFNASFTAGDGRCADWICFEMESVMRYHTGVLKGTEDGGSFC